MSAQKTINDNVASTDTGQTDTIILENINALGISPNTVLPTVSNQELTPSVQNLLKRPLLSESGGGDSSLATKLFLADTRAVTSLVNTAMASMTGTQGSPKTITITNATPMTPNNPGTPKKIAISPAHTLLKSPTKITMIPIGKSPQRIAPAPSNVLLGKISAGTQHSVVNTITMSPSKVMIKQPSMSGSTVAISGANQTLKQFINTGSTPVQGIQIPGKTFPYVRLVNAPTSGTKPSTVSIAPAPAKASGSSQVRITVPYLQSGAGRLLLPATSGFSSSTATSTQSIPPGAKLISGVATAGALNLQSLQNLQGYALVPAQYVTQLQQSSQAVAVSTAPSSVTTTKRAETTSSASSGYIPIASSDPALSTLIQQSVRHHGLNGQMAEATGARPRKPCNCTKSQCLKLYCDCFANGEFCHNCNCHCCSNNIEHEEERAKAIKSCLDRNPHAFHPKIGKGKPGEGDRRHQKGCNCKRSGCLKNYCECYEAKIMCSSKCKCSGCKNFEESPDRKTLMHLADAAEVRVQQQTAATTKMASQMQDFPSRLTTGTDGERLPYTFVTQDVCEAAISCLLAQADDAEKSRQSEANTQALVLHEFGRCLMQIIESANQTKAPSPEPE